MENSVQYTIGGKPEHFGVGKPPRRKGTKAGPGRNPLNKLLVRKSQFTMRLNLCEVALAQDLMEIHQVGTMPELLQVLLQNEALRRKSEISKSKKPRKETEPEE